MIKKVLLKATIAIILCGILAVVSNSLMPILGNELAIGQLENDNAYFIAMTSWHQMNYYLGLAGAAIWAFTITNISIDIYKYMKNKKGENE